MENILKVVTINIDDDNVEIEENRGTMSHANFPYRPNDISLPTDCSVYVYMLISLRSNDFCYVGKTKDLHQRMVFHQSGHGSRSSLPEHLRPYAYFA
jgi:hypothetical protein